MKTRKERLEQKIKRKKQTLVDMKRELIFLSVRIEEEKEKLRELEALTADYTKN